jgi:LytS/YehU family sensor histidine kinase
LQLLKAQIHPHFLFNSLNNIYSFALENSPKAPEMIQKLSGLLQYMLYGCKQSRVPLEKEIKMIEDYLSLEKIRYGDRLKIEVEIQPFNNHQLISPLLLIPFVENSFKHGTSKMLARPYVILNSTVQDDVFYFKLSNSKPSSDEEISVNGNRGLGLKNVKKRLELLYPDRHELYIMDDPTSYTVWLRIDLGKTKTGNLNSFSKNEIPAYELA